MGNEARIAVCRGAWRAEAMSPTSASSSVAHARGGRREHQRTGRAVLDCPDGCERRGERRRCRWYVEPHVVRLAHVDEDRSEGEDRRRAAQLPEQRSASDAHQPEPRDGCRTYDHTSEDDERKGTPDEGGEYVEAVVIGAEEPSGGVPHGEQRPEEVEQGGALMKSEGPPVPVYERGDRVFWEHLLQLETEMGAMDRIDAQGDPGNERDERRRRQANPDVHTGALIRFGLAHPTATEPS